MRKRKNITIAFVSAFIVMASPISAQQKSREDTTKKNKTIIFPAISYAPETSVAPGMSALKLFAAEGSKNSQVTTTGLYTFKNQFLIESNAQVYFRQNQFMAKARFNLNKYPENYFGIGNHTEDSAKVLVSYYVVKLEGGVMRQAASDLYIGPKINLSHYFNVQSEQADKIKDAGENGGFTTGLGLTIIYDHRDNNLTASNGTYTEISSVWNNSFFGGRFSYYSLDADLRKYFPVTKHTVVAVQAIAQLKTGNVPFLQLSYLGGSNIMRGYYAGRYRDKNLFATQAEIRQQLTRTLGVVLFAGYGEVAGSIHEFNIKGLHNSIGAGIRRRLTKTEKVNLRVDVGFAGGKTNFYVNISEAF